MYCLFNRHRDVKIMLISLILILVLVILFDIFLFWKFDFNDSYSGIVRVEDDVYVLIFVDDNGVQEINNKQLVLNKKYLDYSIVKIDDEYTLTEFGPKRCIYLKFDFDDKYKINNNILNLKFVYKKTIFDKFKEML